MTVHLPWTFGTVVYLRNRQERIKGLIVGYTLDPRGFCCWVAWPDTSETKHFALELTTEYLPDYET